MVADTDAKSAPGLPLRSSLSAWACIAWRHCGSGAPPGRVRGSTSCGTCAGCFTRGCQVLALTLILESHSLEIPKYEVTSPAPSAGATEPKPSITSSSSQQPRSRMPSRTPGAISLSGSCIRARVTSCRLKSTTDDDSSVLEAHALDPAACRRRRAGPAYDRQRMWWRRRTRDRIGFPRAA